MVTISVAMATYNGGRFLREQLDSLRKQALLPFELHVGDDGSSDETLAILSEFKSNAPFPVHVHVNQRNLGFGENFIRTALRCSGEWIAFCDQDDVWLPRKLELCAAEIENGPATLCLIAHDAIVTDDSLTPSGLMFDYPPRRLYPRLAMEPDWHCVGFTQLVRASLLTDIPACPRPTRPRQPWKEAHDVWSAVLANAVGSILLLGEPLVLYRRHEATVTGPVRPTHLIDRIRASLQNNGATYPVRAEYLDIIAGSLARNSAGAETQLASLMTEAAAAISRYSKDVADRADIYLARRRRTGLATLLRLARTGAYVGGRWPFGIRSLLKDAVGLCLVKRDGHG